MNANLERYAIVEELNGNFTVSWQGRVIARARSVLCLHEYGGGRALPPVYYFRPADVETASMEPSSRFTRCPIKGQASYRHLVGGNHRGKNAAWTYLHPLPMADGVRGCYAFDPDQVKIAADSNDSG